jgi:hypothetical protein
MMIPACAQVVGSNNTYLIYPNQAACLARSQQMCQAMGYDGKQTIYWWDCNAGPLSAGTQGVIDLTVNGSTAAGMGGISVTTSTGNSSTYLGTPTATTYLNAGDVLATVASSVVAYSAEFVLAEF